MIAETIPTKIHYIVNTELVHRTVLGALIIVAYQQLGSATAMTIAVMVPMNHQNIVRAKVVRASAIYSLVITATVYLEFTYATATTIV